MVPSSNGGTTMLNPSGVINPALHHHWAKGGITRLQRAQRDKSGSCRCWAFLLNRDAIRQAEVGQNLPEVCLEALGNSGLHGDRELDADPEIRAAPQFRKHLCTQSVPDLRRDIAADSELARGSSGQWFRLRFRLRLSTRDRFRCGFWCRPANRDRLRWGLQGLCLVLQEQEDARLKGNICRVDGFLKQNPLIPAIGLLAVGKPEVAPAHELDDLAAQGRIGVQEPREGTVQEALPQAG